MKPETPFYLNPDLTFLFVFHMLLKFNLMILKGHCFAQIFSLENFQLYCMQLLQLPEMNSTVTLLYHQLWIYNW